MAQRRPPAPPRTHTRNMHHLTIRLLLVALALSFPLLSSACPNGCSQAGLCGAWDTCSCYTGYEGADCSSRSCPTGPAWVAKAGVGEYPVGDPHALILTCSGVGLCDGVTGTCTCPVGYTGRSCERRACLPYDTEGCNGKGKCVDTTLLQRVTSRSGALDPSSSYSFWDGGRYSTCDCDGGYTGQDCSLAICPMGDNPLTTLQQRRVIRVVAEVASSTGLQYRRFRLWFSGSTSGAIDFSTTTSTNCAQRFASGGNIDPTTTTCRVQAPGTLSSVDGTMLGNDQYEAVLSLVFPLTSVANNHFSHDGTPTEADFGCFIDPGVPADQAASASCSVSIVDVTTMEFLQPPSDDITPGTSFMLTVSDADALPNLVTVTKIIEGSPPTVNVLTPPIAMTIDSVGVQIHPSENVWVRWNALFGHTRDASWTLTTPLSVGDANQLISPTMQEYEICSGIGLCDFEKGLCKCPDGFVGTACEIVVGAVTGQGGGIRPVLDVTALPTDYSGSIVQVTSTRPLSSAFNFIACGDVGKAPIFSVRGDGMLTTGSLDISRGGMIQPRLQVAMPATAASSYSGSAVLSVYYGSSGVAPSPLSAVMEVKSEFPLDASGAAGYGLLRVGARTVSSTYGYTDLLTVRGDGRTLVQNGVTVNTGGLSINAGGVSITAGGLLVQTGVTSLQGGVSVGGGGVGVTAGGISIIGGVMTDTLFASGVSTFNDLVTATAGIEITSGGLDVDAGGVYIGSGGLSLNAGGAMIAGGGASVLSGSIWASDAATSNTAAVRLAGGGTGAGGAASFAVTSSVAAGYAGDVVYIEGPPYAGSGAHNLLVLAGDAGSGGGASVVIDKDGFLTTTSTLLLQTASIATQTADISIIAGTSSGANGGKVAIVAGISTAGGNGGDLLLRGGAGAVVGGNAVLKGGVGDTGDGGNVILQPGSSSSAAHGDILMKDAAGTTRLTITGDGDVLFSPAAGNAVSLISSAAPLVTSATVLSLTASTAVVARGDDGVGGADGGSLSLIGGAAAASGGAGSIFLTPGSSDSGDSGTIRMRSASSAGSSLRFELSDADTKIFADSGASAFEITHGATPSTSETRIAGSLSIAGAATIVGGVDVSGGVVVSSGAVSVATSAGVTGDPLTLRGVDATIGTTAGGSVSAIGGASTGGAGGDIVLAPGAGGGGGADGSVTALDGAGTARLRVDGNGVTVLTGDLTVSSGAISTPFFSASSLIVCDATAWAASGACDALVSVSAATATKYKLYWNADTVAHDITSDGVTLSIPAVTMFPVFS